MRLWNPCVLTLLVACGGDATKDATDATDATDAQDTGTGSGEPDATGTWTGNCSGDFSTTSSGYTYTGALDADSTLELVDTDGAVAGQWLYSLSYTTTTTTYSSGYQVAGTRDGDHVLLDATTGTTDALISFDLTLAGDEATGDLILEQYGIEHHFPCTFTR